MPNPSLLQEETGFLAQKYDFVTDRVLFVRLPERRIREASFLDDRLLTPDTAGFWCPLAQAREYAGLTKINFILHAGHTGSTLLSRLLADDPSVLPLREPLPLRSLAELHDSLDTPHALFGREDFAARLDLMLNLWARGFSLTKRIIIKATSTTARMAPALFAARPEARAVYMTLRAEPYLATLLAGASSMTDLVGHAQERNRRLERLIGEAPLILYRATAGELAAMAWVAEMLSLQAAIAAAGSRLMVLDFEEMLANLDGTLTAAAGHLEVPLIGAAQKSAILGRYAKAPEQAYSPQLRSQLLAQIRQERATELRRGLTWLEQTAKRFPAVSGLLTAA